ncbi:MAG: hypothetical protein PHF86_14760 [Candidatus Nanoarchaeia archaeon]|nr:hypothetical protein [Candidatus Nanoarchaeia archaeon]
MEEYKQIFKDFFEEGISAESNERFGVAVSNYYKSLTTLCSYLIENKLRKHPKSHTEIFLSLKVSFPEIHKIVDNIFTVYTDSYNHIMNKEDCTKIKNAIKEIAKLGEIEKEFEVYLKKI